MEKKCKFGLVPILISFGAVAAIWQLVASFGGFNPTLFPGVDKIGKAMIELFNGTYYNTSGRRGDTLYHDLLDSLIRFGYGYVIAATLAVLLGVLLGWHKKLFSFVNPAVQLIRPVSPMAWMPFIVLLFGIGNTPAIVIIFIAVFFPVLLTTVKAVGSIEPVYLKVASNFGIQKPALFTKIILPAVFPQIAQALHLAIGSAWIFLVAGEMVGAQSGLGYLIIDARNNLRADVLVADIILIGVIGLLLDSLIGLAEKKIWKNWGV